MTAMSSVPGPATAGEVFSLVRDGRARTRSDIGRLTGLSRTAVAARIASLLESGLVVEGVDEEREPSTGGGPPGGGRFNPGARGGAGRAVRPRPPPPGGCGPHGRGPPTPPPPQEGRAAP